MSGTLDATVQVDAPGPSTAAPAPAPAPAADAAFPPPPPGVPVVREGDAFILDINDGDRQALMRARADG